MSQKVPLSLSAFGIALLVTALFLFTPLAASAQAPVKAEGTAQANVYVWLPDDTVELPAIITADYQAPEDLPQGLSYPPASVGFAFSFGLWKGENVSVSQFEPSMILNVTYQDAEVELAGVNEESLALLMYNPATRAWVKTCSSVDIYLNTVSAALSQLTPFPEGGGNLAGSNLLVIAADPGPSLVQQNFGGATNLALPNSNLRLQVLPQTLDAGAHFQVTPLPNIAGSQALRLLARPADIKICLIDHTNPTQNSRQVMGLNQALTVSFDYDPATLSRAGGRANLTLANLRGARWIDLEELGLRVVRDSNDITVDTREPGTFGLAAR